MKIEFNKIAMGSITVGYKQAVRMVQKSMFLLLVLFGFMQSSFAQENGLTKPETHVSGSISYTYKGISLIPSFTLGKPAGILDLSISKGRFSFEPTLRFALEDFKPWAYIFWFRYKVVESDRFSFRVGAHPAYSFKSVDLSESGFSKDAMMVRRYLAGELAPSYSLSKKISINPYYLIAHGLGGDVNNYTHYVAFRSDFSDIPLAGDFSFSLSPQLYYLNIDGVDGYYVSSGISLKKQDFPFSISGMVNKTIDSEIGGDDFIWDISLVYSFSKKYKEQ